MKIAEAKNLVGFGITNLDVFWQSLSGSIPENAVRTDYDTIWKLVEERRILPGHKYSCRDIAEFDLFRAPFERMPVVSSPGGSLFNTFCGLGKSLCGLRPHLYTYIGNGFAAPQIREVCKNNGVHLEEIPIPQGFDGPVNIPQNLVLVPPEGDERILIKGPGEVVKAAFRAYVLHGEIIKSSDAVFIQGALIMRLGMGFFESSTSHVHPRSVVIFSLPTVDKYPENFGIEALERIKNFVFRKTAVLSSTREEFLALFGQDFEAGLQQLQEGWKKNPFVLNKDRRLALITDGKNGATLVIEGQGSHPVKARSKIAAAHKVGAGDAALAGFIAGLKAGLPPLQAAELAMDFGTIKAAQPEKISIIRNPIDSLRRIGGKAAHAYLDYVEHRASAATRRPPMQTARLIT